MGRGGSTPDTRGARAVSRAAAPARRAAALRRSDARECAARCRRRRHGRLPARRAGSSRCCSSSRGLRGSGTVCAPVARATRGWSSLLTTEDARLRARIRRRRGSTRPAGRSISSVRARSSSPGRGPECDRPRFVPASTYRLQVHAGFTLHAARDIVPYLQRLGIGAVYTSPVLRRRAGQHARLRRHQSQRAEPRGRRRRGAHGVHRRACASAGLQHIVDFVPNHMGIAPATNPWWRDVLENGPSRRRRASSTSTGTRSSASCGASCCCRSSAISTAKCSSAASCSSSYADEAADPALLRPRLPINPRSVPRAAAASPRCRRTSAATVLAEFNGTPGQPRSFDALHELLEQQAVPAGVLADRVARDQLPPLLRRQHAGRPARRGPDGLRRRSTSCWRGCCARGASPASASIIPTACSIRRSTSTCCRTSPPRPGTSQRGPGGAAALRRRREDPVRRASACRRGWAVHGTTGYNFLNQVNGLFVDPANARRMRRVYAKLTGRTQTLRRSALRDASG